MASRGVSSLSSGSGRWQQPLRATVPFQLRGAEGVREASAPCSARVEKPSAPLRTSRVRRTSSLDTIIGSYLQGQWPREPDGAEFVGDNNKATQTPFPWPDAAGPRTVVHKRSASWGSAELQSEVVKVKHRMQKTKLNQGSQACCSPVLGDHTLGGPRDSPPVYPLASSSVRHRSRRNRSLEDLELEEVFVKNTGEQQLLRILDVPDGHRAPIPQRCYSGLSQEMNSLSLSRSPSTPLRTDQSPSRTAAEGMQNLALQSLLDTLDKDGCSSSPVCAAAASPRPNHSFKFQREPPEGCEKVEAYEETLSQSLDPALLHYGPDKNKVHFIPTGSAFCPISLVKPLLPKVDFFLRNFPAPGGSGYSGHLSTCQIKGQSAYDGSNQESNNFSEAPAHHRCSPSQATEGSTFHSSLVV